MATARTPKKLKDVELQKLYRFGPGRVRGSLYILLTLAKRDGWNGSLNGSMSGARAGWQQRFLWLKSKVGGAPAHPPGGPSRHETKNTQGKNHWRQAIDASDVDTLIRKARDMGVRLHRPYGNEPWHVEAARRFSARDLLRQRGLL